MLRTQKPDKLPVRFIANDLNLTLEQFDYFLRKHHSEIPIMKNGSNNPLSWEMDIKYIRKIVDKFNSLNDEEIKRIRTYSYSENRRKDYIIEDRRILCEYFEKKCKMIGKISKFGDNKYATNEFNKTICVNNIFDYEKGIKLADHIWISVKEEKLKLMNLGDWILFEGSPFIYDTMTKIGTIFYKIGIKSFKHIKNMTIDELKDWKDKILLERRLSYNK